MVTNYFVGNDWNKHQYQNLGETRPPQSTSARFTLSILLLSLCSVFIIFSLWSLSQCDTANINVFYLNTEQPLLHVTSTKFLSFGLDSSLLRNMKDFPITDERLINLARHLKPAFVRIGGTSADCLFFNETSSSISTKVMSPIDGSDISNFTFTSADFESLYRFTKRAQLRMIFDLNVLIRNADNSWNYVNAEDIIMFTKGHGMELDWQLGNEPNSFRHVFNITITAKQLAEDYYQLRSLLNNLGYEESLLVGPEVNHIGDADHKGQLYAKIFLENDKDSIDYVTWHQYYLNGREAQVKDFVNPAVFNYLPAQIESMLEAINASNKSISMWMSETSSAYGGGAPGLSDRFVAGFLWLDKLGYSAKAGVNVVVRQSLFGGYYAMVGPDLLPNSDWWISVLYKQFVSEKVLKLITPKNSGHVRLYAHCTSENALINRVPAITIYGVNIDKLSAKIIFHGILPIYNGSTKIFLYILTSDHLTSRKIKLNGEVLNLRPDGKLPSFKPLIVEPTQIIFLPPFSMIFAVIHGVNISTCIP